MKATTMSLTSLNTARAANEGRPMNVLHPEKRTPLQWGAGDEKQNVSIMLLGKDSNTFIQAEEANRDETMANMTEGAKFSSAEQRLKGAEILASCTTGWSGVPQGWLDGTNNEEPAEFSRANAIKLYMNPGVTWVRDQVDKFVGTRANFLTASPGA
jgi:hypothetical protein